MLVRKRRIWFYGIGGADPDGGPAREESRGEKGVKEGGGGGSSHTDQPASGTTGGGARGRREACLAASAVGIPSHGGKLPVWRTRRRERESSAAKRIGNVKKRK